MMSEGAGIRDPRDLPAGLPVPEDDGAARHLDGLTVPSVPLESTAGRTVDLHAASLRSRVVVYAYPRTGRPGEEALGGQAAWDAVPGARGCTPQTLGYAGSLAGFTALGVAVYGVSTQTPGYQREAAHRLGLRHELLSDHCLDFATALRLPTFTVDGTVLLRRLTLVLDRGRIVHVRYPVFPPDEDATATLAWLR